MIALPQPSRSKWAMVADLTPLIDVLFMLIIFMVLTANSAQIALDAVFPNTEETTLSAPESDAPLTVVVRSQGPFYQIDGQSPTDWEAAKQSLLSRHSEEPDRPVVLVVEPDSESQKLLDVLAYLQANNIVSAQIIAEVR